MLSGKVKNMDGATRLNHVVMIIRFYLVLASKRPKQILYPAFNSLPFDICMLIYRPNACHYKRIYITLKKSSCVDCSAAMLNYVFQLCYRKSRPSWKTRGPEIYTLILVKIIKFNFSPLSFTISQFNFFRFREFKNFKRNGTLELKDKEMLSL